MLGALVAAILIAAPIPAPPPPLELDYQSAVAHEVGAFIVADTARLVGEHIAAEQARAEVAQEAAREPAAAPRASGGEVGECTGFAIPDYIIQRESGGSSTAMNPSGAYGCAQTLLSHYSGGSCSGLDPYSIEGQRQCVNILSNGGTNLAPWAATR